MKLLTVFIVALALYSCSPRQTINSRSISDTAATGSLSNDKGVSFSDAVVVNGVTSQREMMAAEYHHISNLHGKRGQDWFLVGQTIITNQNKVVDVVEIQLSNSSDRQVIYFDATSFFMPNKTENALTINIP